MQLVLGKKNKNECLPNLKGRIEIKFLENLRKPPTLKSIRKHIDIDFERVSTVCALVLLTKIEILTHRW